MREQPYESLSLFGQSGSRKYLNAAEQRRFLESAQRLPPHERMFCQVLAWSGARISEGRLKFVQDQLRIEVSTDEIEKRIAELKASVLRSEALDLGEGSAEMMEKGTQGGRKRSSKSGNQPPSPPP